jgi:exonuclease III
MSMRIITWNMRRATAKSTSWEIFSNLNPDIALLQEVINIPASIRESYELKFHNAIGETGKPQKFSTVVMTKGKILGDFQLSSEYEWVNHELKYFNGNIVTCAVHFGEFPNLNIMSIYSPAWPLDTAKYPETDIAQVKSKENPRVWMTDLLWSALKNTDLNTSPLVVGGDFNSSETFDLTFGSGNREFLDKMKSLRFTECLRKYNGRLTPTFRNVRGGKSIHQMDHLFVSDSLYSVLYRCSTGDEMKIFGQSISDHLPIIADFNKY